MIRGEPETSAKSSPSHARDRSRRAGPALPPDEPVFTDISEVSTDYTQLDLLRILFKHKNTILISTVVSTVAVLAGLMLLPPTYTAKGKVLVRTEMQSNPSFFSGIAALTERRDGDPVNRRMETEMELIETAPLARQVVEEMDLRYDQVYHSPLAHLTRPLADLYDAVRHQGFGQPLDPERYGRHATAMAFQKSVAATTVKSKSADVNSNIVEISLKAPTAHTAQAALTRLLELYVRFETRSDEQMARQAAALVESELAKSGAEVNQAQGAMRTFLGRTGFVPPLSSAAPSGPDGAASSMPSNMARSQRADGVITTPRDEESVAHLKARLVDLDVDLVTARQIYKESSPAVQAIRREMGQLRQRIDAEVAQIADNYSRFNELDRHLRAAESHFDDLQRKHTEIALYLQVTKKQQNEREILEPPASPDSSDWKKRLLIALVGVLVGLTLGVGLAGLGEYSDQTLGSKLAVRRHLALDVLSVIPPVGEEVLDAAFVPGTRLEVNLEPDRIRLESEFQALAARLAMRWPAGDTASGSAGRSLLVTSARAGEGKTTVAAALAVQLARLGYGKVLLVDAACDDPQLERRFIVPHKVGFSTLLASGRRIEPQIGQSSTPELTVLPAGEGLDRKALLNQGRLRDFVTQAREQFDWIIFDGGSASDVSSMTLAQCVDLTLLVVDAERTRRHVVQDGLKQLAVDPRKIVGTILNRQPRYIPAFIYNRL